MEWYTYLKQWLQRYSLIVAILSGILGGIACVVLAGPRGIVLAVILAGIILLNAIATPEE